MGFEPSGDGDLGRLKSSRAAYPGTRWIVLEDAQSRVRLRSAGPPRAATVCMPTMLTAETSSEGAFSIA
jgi:hypothetical protein